jgi:hypothetical protein
MAAPNGRVGVGIALRRWRWLLGRRPIVHVIGVEVFVWPSRIVSWHLAFGSSLFRFWWGLAHGFSLR